MTYRVDIGPRLVPREVYAEMFAGGSESRLTSMIARQIIPGTVPGTSLYDTHAANGRLDELMGMEAPLGPDEAEVHNLNQRFGT